MWFDFALLSRLIRSSRAGNTANSGCVDDYFRRARESDSLFADGWFLGSPRQTGFTWSGNHGGTCDSLACVGVENVSTAPSTLAIDMFLQRGKIVFPLRNVASFAMIFRYRDEIYFSFFSFLCFPSRFNIHQRIARNMAWYCVLSRHETRRGVALSLAEFFPPMQIFMWRNVERSQSHSSGICTLFERANKYHDPAQLFSPQRCLRNSETDRPRNY